MHHPRWGISSSEGSCKDCRWDNIRAQTQCNFSFQKRSTSQLDFYVWLRTRYFFNFRAFWVFWHLWWYPFWWTSKRSIENRVCTSPNILGKNLPSPSNQQFKNLWTQGNHNSTVFWTELASKWFTWFFRLGGIEKSMKFHW